MKIEHIAIWVKDLEQSRAFYQKYFGAVSNEKYHNPAKNFQSYFLSFDKGCRLEIMTRPDIKESENSYESQQYGIIHLAFSVNSKEKVDELTEVLRKDGYTVAGEPRTTGDGYYESVILDPENNIIEIVSQ
ncbi:Predicted lactoylglutathione lyase [Chryseobacterium gleum]|uniref:Predicted lactoylglutathione lyase n=2 Tax=Chryseobacterium gleum TaxID=250 RepID=A0A448B7F9_CHRGE|nr:VOC family protein [Chryseobacterium gleum]EFK37011.1 glyoxalase family protein [Chryseobacterium gleum ATCC 35910]MCE4067286.1 VOC family protein [Chryseobacterium gleum]QQY32282.1 VOC family protein [Chryseobacterium gleum]VEE10513.1 Predicted lactoylglutathione lyase [Chryseobacterium gleum]